MVDYYDILGVPHSATVKEIRAAYRRLARKHHPDVNPGDKGAEERFKKVNEAYEVLSDPEKRKRYDQFGESWRVADQFAAGGRGEPFGRPPDQVVDLSDTGLGDLLGEMFGRPGGHATSRTRRVRLREQLLEVSLQEAYKGAVRSVEVGALETCGTCQGTGSSYGTICPSCLGQGSALRPHRIEVRIPPGVADGSRLTYPVGPERLVFVVRVLPHLRFRLQGDDLHTTVTVDLYTAVLGGEVEVPTLNGKLFLKVPAGTQNGRVFRLSGQGMPAQQRPSQRGDMLVAVEVRLPASLTEQERELFRKLQAMRQGAR
ncbi:MAG: J domain-containing protein [Chloroflexi bacterium]|nr:J domain-containing protein [Chloroflexota bacterium]